MMTTHPEDAMTRERALEEALRKYGDHLRSCHTFKGGRNCTCGLDAALASAQQEPTPSADAEEVGRKIAQLETGIAAQVGGKWSELQDLYKKRAALRRYAGDGVTDAEWPYEVWQAGASKWHELDLEAKRLNSVIGTRVDMLKFIWAAMNEAAARARPSEKAND